ncbi:response regulator transcription factor [bacterium]|nr:response regulator transcription factor [bacterium]
MTRPRVLLADDHRLVAEGLQSLLEPHFDVVGITAGGRELIEATKRLDPEVIVLDISMPSLNGIEAARRLRTGNSRVKLVLLAVHCEVAYAARAMEAGVSGYVLKQSAASELIAAIRVALEGGTYVPPQIAKDLGLFWRGAPTAIRVSSGLTPRQQEVLQLVSEGHSAKEIAAVLHVTRRTVEFHKAQLMKYLGVHNTAGLIQYAIRTDACLK